MPSGDRLDVRIIRWGGSENRAQKLYQSGDHSQAIELLKKSIDANRGDNLKQAMAWSNLALVYQQSGDSKAANGAICKGLMLLQAKSLPGSASILAQTLNIQGQSNQKYI